MHDQNYQYEKDMQSKSLKLQTIVLAASYLSFTIIDLLMMTLGNKYLQNKDDFECEKDTGVTRKLYLKPFL
jgi:hypothetical protein